MLFSFVVPHKNSVETLESLLISLKGIPNIEIIVVDDCSSYYELRKLRSLKGDYGFQLIESERSVTAGGARNIGLKHTRGDWVLFADSDDEFIPACLMKLLIVLESSESQVVYFNCESKVRGSGAVSTRTAYINKLISNENGPHIDIPFRWTVPWGRAIRRSVLEGNGIRFEERPFGNDVVFSTHLAIITANSYDIFRETVYRCYESNQSLTATLNPQKAYHRLQAICKKSQLIIKHDVALEQSYGFTYAKELVKSFSFRNYFLLIRWFFLCFIIFIHNIKVKL